VKRFIITSVSALVTLFMLGLAALVGQASQRPSESTTTTEAAQVTTSTTEATTTTSGPPETDVDFYLDAASDIFPSASEGLRLTLGEGACARLAAWSTSGLTPSAALEDLKATPDASPEVIRELYPLAAVTLCPELADYWDAMAEASRGE
jgi:Tfp pilus assembly protein PilV